MDIEELFPGVEKAMVSISGSAGILEDLIVLDWNHMSGVVSITEAGRARISVGTKWQDKDVAFVDDVADIPRKIAELFEEFWERRGVHFRKA